MLFLGLLAVLILIFPCRLFSQSIVSTPNAWSYEPDSPRGPSHWSTLDPSFSVCSSGQQQSPIDLPASLSTPASPTLAIHWDDLHSSVASASSPSSSSFNSSDQHTVLNTGHSILVKFDSTHSHVTLDSTPYTLIQFHFHSPSEHTVSSHPHDMELHLVHSTSQGDLLVVGVFIDADPNEEAEEAARHKAGASTSNSASDFLRALAWSHLPPSSQSSPRPSKRPLLHLLQSTLSSSAHTPAFYAYAGSLTTPPCTEGVRWFVYTQPLHISTAELEHYRRLFQQTARPVQPLHGRPVTRVTTPSAHSYGPLLLIAGLAALLLLIAVVWACTRYLHHETLGEGLMAAVQENVARDKEQDKQWRTERDGEVGRRGGRASLLSGRRRGGLGYQEEDLAPLLSTYPPSSFPPAAAGGSGGVGGG